MSKPLVSVWCSTYNHEKYIAQAIDGFVMQKTDFEIEIFVHDDASTDETANIVRRYAAKHPQITAIYQTENKFSVDKSFLNRIMFEKTAGKYIAMCEGDDYWTDPLKLQKQIDFLEANPDYAICFHSVEVVYENGSEASYISNPNQKATSDFEDLAARNYIHTLSCVFRNHLFDGMPEWFAASPVGDYPLHLLNARHGKIKFLEDVMAVYRIHDGGIWESNSGKFRMARMISVIETCRREFYPAGDGQFGRQACDMLVAMCNELLDARDFDEYRKYYLKYLNYLKFSRARQFLFFTRQYFLSFFKSSQN